MRRLSILCALVGLLTLGACSSSSSLTGPGSDTQSRAVLHDGQEGGSNNGTCNPRC